MITPPSVNDLLAQTTPSRAAEARKGMRHLEVVWLEAPQVLCRFSSQGVGPRGWLDSPWWITLETYRKLLEGIPPQTGKANVHGPDFIARSALALPHYWSDSAHARLNYIDVLVHATLQRPGWALVGLPRPQHEIANNGARVTWTGWNSIKQLFLVDAVLDAKPRGPQSSAFAQPGPAVPRSQILASGPLFQFRATFKVPQRPLFQR